MRRHALNFAGALSLVLFVATVVLWARSYFVDEDWRGEPSGDFFGLGRLSIRSTSGAVTCCWLQAGPLNDYPDFHFRCGSFFVGSGCHFYLLGSPHWAAVTAFAAFPLLTAGFRRTARVAGLCSECGYDLTANVSGVCPECGTAL